MEQYRVKYVFLAPSDYTVNYADIVAPSGAKVLLDGTVLDLASTLPLPDGYVIVRAGLMPGANGGAHVLLASAPVGVQVLGYGEFTSYQYPGGLDLKVIAPPPVTQ